PSFPTRRSSDLAGRLPIHHAAKNLRTGADQRALRTLQIKHEGRRIDDPQRAIHIKWIGTAGHPQALAGDKLKDVARLDVLLPLENRLFKCRLREIALKFQIDDGLA